jgi:hypothetical protein
MHNQRFLLIFFANLITTLLLSVVNLHKKPIKGFIFICLINLCFVFVLFCRNPQIMALLAWRAVVQKLMSQIVRGISGKRIEHISCLSLTLAFSHAVATVDDAARDVKMCGNEWWNHNLSFELSSVSIMDLLFMSQQ